MFRNCCLVVLNSGVDEDNFEVFFVFYENFEIKFICCEWGVKIEFVNFFEVVFVDEKFVCGVYEYLFVVFCDLFYMGNKYVFFY